MEKNDSVVWRLGGVAAFFRPMGNASMDFQYKRDIRRYYFHYPCGDDRTCIRGSDRID